MTEGQQPSKAVSGTRRRAVHATAVVFIAHHLFTDCRSASRSHRWRMRSASMAMYPSSSPDRCREVFGAVSNDVAGVELPRPRSRNWLDAVAPRDHWKPSLPLKTVMWAQRIVPFAPGYARHLVARADLNRSLEKSPPAAE